MDKMEIKVDGETKVLTVLQGDALPQKEPVKVEKEGNIKGPVNYATVREPDNQKAIVTFSRSGMKIVYEEDGVNHYGAKITGKLIVNPALSEFKINANGEYNTDQLAKFLRMRKPFFSNPNECDALVKALTTCMVKVQKKIEKDNDNRGNKKIHYDQVIESEIPKTFKLKMPVFVGFDAKEFVVELFFDSSDSSIKIWLESVELNDVMLNERDIIIDQQLAFFEEKKLVIIEQ